MKKKNKKREEDVEEIWCNSLFSAFIFPMCLGMEELVTDEESWWWHVQGYGHLQDREKYGGGINMILNTFGSEYLQVYWENLKGRDNFGDLGTDGRVVQKFNL
jgi:hypothetical protein